MKILMTSIACRSGLFTHVLDLVKGMRRQGIDALLAVKGPSDSKHATDHLESLKLLGNLPYYEYETSTDLGRYARAIQASVIHAHSPTTFGASRRVSKALSVPLVLTLHSPRNWSKRFARTLQYADRIIAVGPAQARSVLRGYGHKLRVVANGINLSRFRPPKVAPPLRGALRVIWFGRTNGPLTLGLAALDQAIGRLKHRGYEILGKKIGIAKGVSVKHMDDCDWLTDPVPYLQEGHVAFGHSRALREAMACGNAGFLVAYGFGAAVREEDFHKAGHSLDAFPTSGFPEARIEPITRWLIKLYTNRAIIRNLRLEAVKLAARHFDRRDMVKDTLDVYQGLSE